MTFLISLIKKLIFISASLNVDRIFSMKPTLMRQRTLMGKNVFAGSYRNLKTEFSDNKNVSYDSLQSVLRTLYKTWQQKDRTTIWPWQISSIVNKWGYEDNFKPVDFFYEKILSVQKKQNQAKTNQQKRKQSNKKQQRQQLLRIKTSKRGKIGYFELWCFLYAQNLFVRKIN